MASTLRNRIYFLMTLFFINLQMWHVYENKKKKPQICGHFSGWLAQLLNGIRNKINILSRDDQKPESPTDVEVETTKIRRKPLLFFCGKYLLSDYRRQRRRWSGEEGRDSQVADSSIDLQCLHKRTRFFLMGPHNLAPLHEETQIYIQIFYNPESSSSVSGQRKKKNAINWKLH